MPTEQLDLEPVARQMEKRQPTIMNLMQLALERGQVDQLRILQEMHFKQEDRDAETEFNVAMNAAQSELGRIAPDLNNPQTKSKYASYAALDRAIRPIYTKHGFSLSFDSGDSSVPETVVAFCYVSHRAGHTRKYQSPPIPADGKGAKGGDVMTKTHATGAAMSYGMRYLLKFIFNIAIGEDDNDGNPKLDDLAERIEFICNCRNMEELRNVYGSAYRDAKAFNDVEAVKAIVAAYEKKKKELQ